jgi:hypothetical protein
VCAAVCIYVGMYIYVYVYIYIHTHTHKCKYIYIYIYIYIYAALVRGREGRGAQRECVFFFYANVSFFFQRLYEGAGGEGHNANVSSGAKAGIHF